MMNEKELTRTMKRMEKLAAELYELNETLHRERLALEKERDEWLERTKKEEVNRG